MQSMIKFKEKDKNFLELIIHFNDIVFNLSQSQLIKEYQEETEYLPGIYIKVIRGKTASRSDDLVQEIEQDSQRHLIKKMIKSVKEGIKVNTCNSATLYLNISNKRDDIVVYKDTQKLYENRKPYQDPINKAYDLEAYPSKSWMEQYEQVETKHIMFPNHSGGWGERCIIKAIFNELKLYHTRNNSYKIFEGNEMYYTVSQINDLKKLCLTSSPCRELVDKFRNNTYRSSSEKNWVDDITLHKVNGVYKVENANHRVCCAKMFEIHTVKAQVHTGVKRRKYTVTQANNPFYLSTPLNKQLTKDYYNILSDIGLNTEESKQILEEGLRGKVLLEYIQHKTGKSLLQLYQEKQEEVI